MKNYNTVKECADGTKYYYLNGKRVTEEEVIGGTNDISIDIKMVKSLLIKDGKILIYLKN